MNHSSSVSRRIEASIGALNANDYETALIHFFPALDKTAKRRYHKDKVGERIKKFLNDELEIITYIATRNIWRVTVNAVDFPEAIYKFGRTSIAHEGELDPRLQINSGNFMAIGHVWNLPPSFIVGLQISVIAAPENEHERISHPYRVTVMDTQFEVNDLWGKRDLLRAMMEKAFGRPLFGDHA